MSAERKRINERSRGAERERGGCGDNRGIDSTRDTPGCFRGLNGSSTTFDNFDNANYKMTDHATTSAEARSKFRPPRNRVICAFLVSSIPSYSPIQPCHRSRGNVKYWLIIF